MNEWFWTGVYLCFVVGLVLRLGRWKREAREWEADFWGVHGERDEHKRIADARLIDNRLLVDQVVDLQREAKQLKAQLAAADFPLQAERDENERIRAKLKTVQSGLDHATHCYEQCEADRQAIAKERDEWRETAEQASAISARVMSRCRDFIDDLSKLRDEPNASDPDPDDHPGGFIVNDLAPEPRHSSHLPGECTGCRRCASITVLCADSDPDFIRFPIQDEGEAPGAA